MLATVDGDSLGHKIHKRNLIEKYLSLIRNNPVFAVTNKPEPFDIVKIYYGH